jgi:hypothetical protein
MNKSIAIAISSLCLIGLGYMAYNSLSRLELDDLSPSFEEEHDDEYDRN